MLTEAQKQLLLAAKEQNIALLYLGEEYPLTELVQSGGMMMCRFLSGDEWCHFSHNSTAGFVDDFFSHHAPRQYVVISDEKVFSHARKNHRLIWSIDCYRLFCDIRNLPQPEIPPGQLMPGHLEIVYENSKYRQFLNMPYLSRRLELGGGFCIMNGGRPVAWMMTHDDGSVGMLHVLDEYRRRGYARRLVLAMSHSVSLRGREVFAHIEPSNTASLNLFQSLGFVIRGKITWACFR